MLKELYDEKSAEDFSSRMKEATDIENEIAFNGINKEFLKGAAKALGESATSGAVKAWM